MVDLFNVTGVERRVACHQLVEQGTHAIIIYRVGVAGSG
jgi:hypothetical protein